LINQEKEELFQELQWLKGYKKEEHKHDEYDFEIKIEVWREIQKDRVEKEKETQLQIIPLVVLDEKVFDPSKKYLICGVLGEYNSGKTWLINKLCNCKLPSGFGEQGASRKIGFKAMGVFPLLFIDTPGLKSPFSVVNRGISKEIKAYDEMIARVLVSMCDFPIFVVNTLTSDQQHFLLDTIFSCHSQKQQDTTKVMIIVHNYSRISSINEVEDAFEFYVRPYFGNIEKRTFFGDDAICYCSQIEKDEKDKKYNIMHFIFAREGSEAGNFYNPKAVQGLRYVVNGNISALTHFDVIERFNKLMENRATELNEPKFVLKRQ